MPCVMLISCMRMHSALIVRVPVMQTAEDFVGELTRRALSHEAVHHAFLLRLATGDLPDVQSSLKDFAFQYDHYRRHFARYLQALTRNVPLEIHRTALQEILNEERGDCRNGFETKPHTELFRDFQSAIGIDGEYRRHRQPHQSVETWANRMLECCNNQNPAMGIGAIGLGTELVVPSIYGKILDSLASLPGLSKDDKIFFELHSHMDDEYAETFRQIAVDLARDERSRPQLERGMHLALDCRSVFWDLMLALSLAVGDEKRSAGA